jgi:hypothetical protein
MQQDVMVHCKVLHSFELQHIAGLPDQLAASTRNYQIIKGNGKTFNDLARHKPGIINHLGWMWIGSRAIKYAYGTENGRDTTHPRGSAPLDTIYVPLKHIMGPKGYHSHHFLLKCVIRLPLGTFSYNFAGIFEFKKKLGS